MAHTAVIALAWPAAKFAEATEALARQAGLPIKPASGSQPEAAGLGAGGDLAPWMEWAATRLGLEAVAVATPIPDYAKLLHGSGPALFFLGAGEEPLLLVVLGCRRSRLRVLAPDLRVRSCAVDAARAALCSREEAYIGADLDRLLEQAEVPLRQRRRARAAMVRDRLAGMRKPGCWLLRLPATAGFWAQLSRARLPARFAWVMCLFGLLYGAEVMGWKLIGSSAFEASLDPGWFAAWVLLLMSMLPLELAASWLNATFALDGASLIKQKLLAGALNMDLEAIRRQGTGQLLGRVIEAQALESLVLNGGLTVLVALIELLLAGWVLSLGLAGPVLVFLLVLTTAGTALLALRYAKRLRHWTDQRLDLTHDLIERMSGHRTSLAQEAPAFRNRREDRALQQYLDASSAMDRAAVPLSELIPRAWIMLAFIGLSPALLNGGAQPTAMAITVGGILLASRTLGKIAGGLAALTRAAIAWQRIAPMFKARRPNATPAPPVSARTTEMEADSASVGALLDAQGLSFRFRADAPAVIDNADLTLHHGDRILLEGPSGGGKSTLASVLVGLREASSGLLLLRGLDRHTLQDAWRRHAAAAPQFHENHILSGSLAFNLLMGRGWPASDADLAEAEALCRELGLGDLLDRMPSGIMQIVGETGWQLSHGERSRVYLARALLQKADLTVLDESFAALDPESLRQCLDCTLKHAETLMVIAHP